MRVTFFYQSPAQPGGPLIAARRQNRPQPILSALCFFLYERRNPPSGGERGHCQPPKRGPGGAHGGEQTNSYNLRRACRRRKSRHQKSPHSGDFWSPPRRGGVLNREGKKVKTKPNNHFLCEKTRLGCVRRYSRLCRVHARRASWGGTEGGGNRGQQTDFRHCNSSE